MGEMILVTGGAGYVGSHTVYRLLEDGRRVLVLDDLSAGHREVVTFFTRVYGPDRFGFVQANLLRPEELRKVFEGRPIAGIIDFAALTQVGESQERSRDYFDTNVLGFRNLLRAAGGVPVVKSSTAAVYGDPDEEDVPLEEDYPLTGPRGEPPSRSRLMPARVGFETLVGWYREEVAAAEPDLSLAEGDLARLRCPTNVYGITKAMDEILLAKVDGARGWRSVSLRYFNAAGAHGSRMIGEDHRPESHLVPLALRVALGGRERIAVFGNDYPTGDGTAIRDYVSVEDLAEAHALCLDRLLSGGETRTYNLGTGSGYSVLQVLEAAREVTGHPIPAKTEPRRNGDPAVLVADSGRIRGELGWEARTSLRAIVESAWHWHRLNPDGYRVAQEERFSPFWNRWINIAAHRGSRPWRGQVETLPDEAVPSYDPGCYLCPGNRRTSGEVNPPYPGVWAFVNDFPTLSPDSPEVDAVFGPYRARTSRGVCEVLNFSPDHGKRLSTMEVDEIAGVVDGWATIYDRLGRRPDIRYVLIFENRGEIMGNSQPHPHGQVYAYGEIPDLIVEPQLRMFREYRGRAGGACFVCDASRAEEEDGRRILAGGERFLAYVPYAAQFPYDVALVPRAHADSLLDLEPPARRELAGLLRRVLRGMDVLFAAPYHYSMALIQAPTDGVDHGYHMQIHLCSLLRGPGLRKHVVGADIFGRIINPSDPNHSAAEIRHAMRKGETP